jgi:hypothetical protein
VLQSQEIQAVWRFQHSGAMLKSPNSNEVAGFEAISACNRFAITYFGLNKQIG